MGLVLEAFVALHVEVRGLVAGVGQARKIFSYRTLYIFRRALRSGNLPSLISSSVPRAPLDLAKTSEIGLDDVYLHILSLTC